MAEDEASQTIVDGVWRNLRAEPRLGPGFHLARIAVEGDGALVMEGEVADLALKKIALVRAATAPGVSAIVDRLRVTARAPMSDRDIRAHLRAMFAQDSDFSDLDLREDVAAGVAATRYAPVAGAGGEARGRIDIEAEDGVVTLNGYVPTLVRQRLAGALAWRIAGVRDVVNGLVVRPAEEDGPDQLEEAIRVVLDREPGVDADQIKVGVRKSVVRLTGLVHTPEARAAAELASWAVLGVQAVVNEIDVRP